MAWQYPPWSGDLVEPPVAVKPDLRSLIDTAADGERWPNRI